LKLSSIVLLGMFAALPACGVHTNSTQAASSSVVPGVGWVISPADGVVRTHCLSPVPDHETAFASLQASGETLEFFQNPAFGIAVCKIGDVGWPAASCFGSSVTDATWMYFVWNRSTEKWESGTVAIDTLTVTGGDLVAFVFTTYDPVTFNPVREPPSVPFSDVCP
jgi:hypothetical protein